MLQIDDWGKIFKVWRERGDAYSSFLKVVSDREIYYLAGGPVTWDSFPRGEGYHTHWKTHDFKKDFLCVYVHEEVLENK